jgi:hypothetical protein
MITDPTLIRIGQAVQLNHHGGEHGDALHVCTLAHAMADVQDDVHQELVWDQRALAAAGRLTDARLTEARLTEAGVTLSVADLYPSLHLNLSECHRRLGDLDRAREHLRQAQATIGALGDDEYAQLIRDGLQQVAERLR